jgi:hypothetical protein
MTHLAYLSLALQALASWPKILRSVLHKHVLQCPGTIYTNTHSPALGSAMHIRIYVSYASSGKLLHCAEVFLWYC